MDHYHIWINLKDTRRDIEFSRNLGEYLGALRRDGRIVGYTLTRRKLGFGPAELGEFQVTIDTQDMAQLEQAFDVVARRSGELETLHANVFSMVCDFRSALYRDFPDRQRTIGAS